MDITTIEITYMTKDEEAEQVRLALAGNTEARNRVVLNILPFVRRLARRYSEWSGVPFDDLFQHGMTSCFDNFDKFKPEMGFRSKTYLGDVAERQIQLFCKQDGVIRRPPLSLKESQMEAEPGKPLPNVVAKGQAAKRVGSLSEPLANGEDSQEILLADPKTVYPWEQLEKKDEHEALYKFLKYLKDREQKILLMRADGKTLSQIGRIFKVSKERVRQLQKRAMHDILFIVSNGTLPPERRRGPKTRGR